MLVAAGRQDTLIPPPAVERLLDGPAGARGRRDRALGAGRPRPDPGRPDGGRLLAGSGLSRAAPGVDACSMQVSPHLTTPPPPALAPKPARRRVGVAADHPSYRWWVLSVTSLGMFLATVNSGTLLIALPDVERELGTSLFTLVWVILAYMVASTVLLLPAGRLADQFGRRGSTSPGWPSSRWPRWGPGLADSGTALILWRILQGAGGAFVFANSGALVTDAFPRKELGLAMGTNVMVAAVGLVMGPILGGWLVGFGWQWVFWFNVPLGVIGTVWAALVLRELARRDTRGRLRHPGEPARAGRAHRPRRGAVRRRPRRLDGARGDRGPDRGGDHAPRLRAGWRRARRRRCSTCRCSASASTRRRRPRRSSTASRASR